MDITIIDKDNLQYFESLLYPQTVELLRAGQPYIALGAVDGGTACGALGGGPQGRDFFVEQLFVCPSCRGRGAGTALLKELIRLCAFLPEILELRCSYTVRCSDHEKLRGFLEKQGFRPENLEDGFVSVPLSTLAELPFYKTAKPTMRVYTLSELPNSLLRGLDRRLSADAGPVFQNPLEKAPIERDLSTATLAGNAIDGCLLFEKLDDGRLSLRHADAGTVQSGGVFTNLLIKSYEMALTKYPADTEVLIQPVTELSQALVKKLAPDARNLSYSAVLPLWAIGPGGGLQGTADEAAE